MSLEDVREKIGIIDKQILECLNKRFELALETRPFKRAVSDKQHEIQVFNRARRLARNMTHIHVDFVEKIFIEIISESKKIQKKAEK